MSSINIDADEFSSKVGEGIVKVKPVHDELSLIGERYFKPIKRKSVSYALNSIEGSTLLYTDDDEALAIGLQLACQQSNTPYFYVDYTRHFTYP